MAYLDETIIERFLILLSAKYRLPCGRHQREKKKARISFESHSKDSENCNHDPSDIAFILWIIVDVLHLVNQG